MPSIVRLRVMAGSVQVEEAQALAKAAADADARTPFGAAVLDDVSKPEAAQAGRRPVDDPGSVFEIRRRRSARALGVEDAGQEALAPVVLGESGHAISSRDALDLGARLRADRRASPGARRRRGRNELVGRDAASVEEPLGAVAAPRRRRARAGSGGRAVAAPLSLVRDSEPRWPSPRIIPQR